MPYQMTREENVFLAKRNLVDSIYRESRLEGINVTFPQTNEIFEGRTVAGLSVDETIAINNLKHAWEFILDNVDAKLDFEFVAKVHALVGEGLVLDAGALRSGSVGIAGTEWRPPVPNLEGAIRLLSDVLSEPPSTERAIRMYMALARAQLFWDGNKRTAQLVANKMLIEGGFGIFTVPVSKLEEFNQLSIDYYDGNEAAAFEDFLLANCIEGF